MLLNNKILYFINSVLKNLSNIKTQNNTQKNQQIDDEQGYRAGGGDVDDFNNDDVIANEGEDNDAGG